MARPYELIVFGATGYTGRYTAEHIAEHAPTNLSWAIAGRNSSKLQNIANELQSLNVDRKPPAIEVAQLDKQELLQLARKTKVLVSAVGPYHRYGTLVVEACAESGTHYADVTGEVPWVRDMIRRYAAVAEKTGAIMLPQTGIESAPADLMAFALASHNRQVLDAGTGAVVAALHEIRSTPSGGTMATVLSIFDSYSPFDFASALKPGALCARVPPPRPSKSVAERITGVRTVDGLGTLTDSIQGPSDTPIVYRSWSLLGHGAYYGPKFSFTPYSRARSAFSGFSFHVVLSISMLFLILRPVRWLLNKVVFQPGEGTEREKAKQEYVEWRSVAEVDSDDVATPRRSFAKLRWQGSLYRFTGVLLGEAGLSLARDQTLAHKLGGGMITPAILGGPYIERLQKAGLQLEVRTLP